MNKRFIWLLIILFPIPPLQAQTLRSSLRKAKEAFYRKDYSTALQFAEYALKKDSLVVDALFIGGESARQLRKFEEAEKLLSRLPDEAKEGTFASTDFNLGLCQKSIGKYEEAMRSFQNYLKQNDSGNDLLSLHATDELETCLWAIKSLETSDSSGASVAAFQGDLSTASSEFAPLRYADKIYFSALYENEKGEAPVSRIFTRTQNFPVRLFKDNPKRPDVHAANVALMPDASRMYFTICRDEEYFQQNRCEIWSMDKTYGGGWTAPSKLGPPVNLRGFTTTHPSIGWNKSLKKYELFFTSDRPGGKGKLDVWAVPIERTGELGEATCLPTNTSADDVTPFFHQASQTLFFSSDGYPGLGGYDVFQTKATEDGSWSSPENMGAPLNTSHDDLYYTWNMGAQRAYLSSNRSNRECPEAPKGDFCTDIFEAEIFATLSLSITDAAFDEPVENFTVYIKSLKSQAPPLEFEYSSTLHPNIALAIGDKYEVTIVAHRYFPHQFILNTTNFTNSEHILKAAVVRPVKVISP